MLLCIFGSLFSDIILPNKFISFLSFLEMLTLRFSRFDLSIPNMVALLSDLSLSNPKGSSLLKHFTQRNFSSLSSSDSSRYLLGEIELQRICTQLSQKSQQITFQNNEILTNTENIILNNLKNAELTATQIQEIIKKSREHTSRILKKLFNNKLIIRNNTRPYTYKINN